MEEMLKECQLLFPNDDIPPNIFAKIYFAAKHENVAEKLFADLNALNNPKLCNYLLNLRFKDKDEQSVTPLVLAAKSRNTTFVHNILTHYDLDLEIECNVVFGSLLKYGVTALWVAARMGHLNIVKLLVNQGANINHRTQWLSSPLRAACYYGRLDIVEYLIESGADVNLPNINDNTCIMVASLKGRTAVVETLLKHGADPNAQTACCFTALHYAAQCGHLEVCQLLLDHGARLQPNEHGLTPVLQAAEKTQEHVVEMFINRSDLMSNEEKIVAVELMGASFANDKDNYNITKAYQYLMNSMEMRYQDPQNIIRKNTIPPVPAYDNWIETETIEELQSIRLNNHFIHMESLTIRERILSNLYPDLTKSIIYRGTILAEEERYEKCIHLWSYAIDLKMINDVSVSEDLSRFELLFSQMISLEQSIDLSLAVSVLVKCQQEIFNNRRKITLPGPKDSVFQINLDLSHNTMTALYLIKIITIIICHQNNAEKISEIQLLNSTVSSLIRTGTRFLDDQTLLHRAVHDVESEDVFNTSDIIRFPCFQTASLLVHNGASVNAEDGHKNTPLHVMLSSIHTPNAISQAEDIVQLLINAGAHLDAVNCLGMTPSQSCSVPSVREMVLRYENELTSLKCIAARSIAFFKLKYKGIIPKFLEPFVHIHSLEK